MRTHSNAPSCTHTNTYIIRHTLSLTHTSTYIHSLSLSHTNTYTHTLTHSLSLSLSNTHTHKHTHAHTHTQAPYWTGHQYGGLAFCPPSTPTPPLPLPSSPAPHSLSERSLSLMLPCRCWRCPTVGCSQACGQHTQSSVLYCKVRTHTPHSM